MIILEEAIIIGFKFNERVIIFDVIDIKFDERFMELFERVIL